MHSTVQFRRTWDEGHLLRQVVQFNVAGSPTGHETNKPLHWRIYMLLDNGYSVLLDMTLLDPFGEDPYRGVLEIDSKNHAFSRTTVANFSMNAARFITVQEVFDILRGLRRDRYQFHETFNGCRFWCETIISDLERRGIVAPGSYAGFGQYIAGNYSVNPGRFPLPTPIGEFN